VNWKHAASNGSSSKYRELGLRIAFDGPDVLSDDLNRQSVIVQTRNESVVRDAGGNQITLVCWCELQGRIVPGDFAALGDATSAFAPATAAGQIVNGVVFFSGDFRPTQYRVLVKGDYVRGLGKRAVDANHLPPWVNSSPAYRTGDGTEGGLFESWLQFEQ
jgi:hypothetical protein